MENTFLLKVLLSFVIGGLWTIISTILADKYGSKIGGFIAGLPSTIVFGLFFIAWTQTPGVAVEATTVVPIIGAVNYLFLVNYAYFIKRGFLLALITSFLLWSIFTFGIILIQFNNYPLSLVAYILMLFFVYWILEYRLKIKSITGQKITYTSMIILLRGLLSGSVIGFAVFIAKIGGPILGGVFSTFPAMFMSTLLITYFTHGSVFSSAITKSLMLGSITVIIYSIVVRYTYLPLGIIWGTIISTVVSLISGYLIYRFIIQKSS